MANSPNLALLLVAASQNQKEVTVNNAIVGLDNAMNNSLVFSFTTNARTLTAAEYTGSVSFKAGALTAAGTLTVPLTERLFSVDNRANTFAVTVKGASGTTAVVSGGSVGLLYCDGTGIMTVGISPATPNTWTAAQRGAPVTLTDAATITPDLALSNNFTVTLAGNRTLANPNNVVAGQTGQIVVRQDATGTRTLAYGTSWVFPSHVAPTLSTAAAAVDVLNYYVIDATHIAVSVFGLNLS